VRHRNPNLRSALAFAVMAAVATFASSVTAQPTSPGHIEFEVFRNGQPFGRQSVVVRESGGQLIAETSADLQANLGPLRVFTYAQRCRETWRDGRLAGLNCSTTKNGRRAAVTGATSADGFNVRNSRGALSFAADVLPTSWWSRPPLSTREMLNTETGQRLPVRVILVGRETIEIGGQRIAADRIRVQGTLTVDLWYDSEGRWVSSAFTIDDQRITYRLVSAPSAGPS